MTPLVWAGLALTALFFGAWYGIPMWMTFKRPEPHPDFTEARAYLRAKAALDNGESVTTVPAAEMAATRRHMTATRAPGRSHPVGAHDDTRVSA